MFCLRTYKEAFRPTLTRNNSCVIRFFRLFTGIIFVFDVFIVLFATMFPSFVIQRCRLTDVLVSIVKKIFEYDAN